jgi:hypothetical protein
MNVSPSANERSGPGAAACALQRGTFLIGCDYLPAGGPEEEVPMDGLIYLIGLIVVIMFILSFFGLR